MPESLAPFPSRLPTGLSAFIGRETQLDQIDALLADPACRLLTLTGPGGCGKTRLAIAAAQRLADMAAFEHGACFVDLVGLDTPIFIPEAVAAALGVAEERERPLVETLAGFLQSRHLLLILDNCEHLLAACADLAQTLLEACPQLRILATSREPLNLPDETVWLVPSLALPDPEHMSDVEHLAKSEAIQLFVARARAALPGFALVEDNAATVEHICRRLDGIPLAIELAAARVKLLAVEQIAARLDDSLQLLTRGSRDAPLRHQTMRAALDWSYGLLSPGERILFQRLAVFAGGFTLEAVEAVCPDRTYATRHTARAGELHAADVFDVLTDLVDKSLVLVAEREPREAVRYRLLEPVQQYTLEALRGADAEAATRDRHLDYYLEFAEQAEPGLKSDAQLLWLKRLDKEHDNLRAALAWSAQHTRHDTAQLRLAQALHYFWQRRGYWSEGRRWLEGAIANYDAHKNSHSPDGDLCLAKAIVAEGWLAYQQGDYGGTRERLERGLVLAQASDDLVTAALVLGLQAQLTSYAGNLDDGLRLSAASVASARRSGDHWTLAWADYIHGMIVYRRDEAAARVALDESVRLFREVGDKRSIAAYLIVMGYITANTGELEAARSIFEEALAIGNELEDKNLQLTGSSNLAHLARLQGDAARAAELYEQVLAQAQDLGQKEAIAFCLDGLGHIRIAQGNLDTASQLLRESVRLFQEIGFHAGAVSPLAGLGRIVAVQGQAALAARVMGAIDASVGAMRLDADTKAALEQDIAPVRAAMLPEAFEAAFVEGRALTLEQALEEVSRPDRITADGPQPRTPAPQTLRLCALGPTRVLRGDQPLSAWPYARVKELLFYLAAQPARSKAHIGLDLWPDASPAQLRNSLSTSLYHLRRTLGNPQWIVFEDDQYRFNRALDYWFDVEAFEALLAQAARLHTHTPERALALLQEAVDLYQGDFVEDYLEGEWFLLRREELRRKYLEALLGLGQLRFSQGDYARAAEAYRRAIEKDAVLEAAHRELMRCYARLGERGLALRQYQTLAQLMQDELGSPPAPESVDLYQRLKRGEEM